MLEELRIRGLGVIDDAVLPLGPGPDRGDRRDRRRQDDGRDRPAAAVRRPGRRGARAHRRRPGRGRRRPARASPPARPRPQRVRDAGGELDDARRSGAAPHGQRRRPLRALRRRRPAPVARARRARRSTCSPCTASPTSCGWPARRAARRPRPLRAASTSAEYAAAYRARGAPPRRSWPTAPRRAGELRREADLLAHGLAEIEAAAPQPGEDVELAAAGAPARACRRAAAGRAQSPTTRCSVTRRPGRPTPPT